MASFLKLDGTVLSEQLAGFDRSRTGPFTIGAGLCLVGVGRLFGGGFLGELPSHPAADLVSTLFDGSEIEVVDFFVRPEDILRNFIEKLLESRVERVVSR